MTKFLVMTFAIILGFAFYAKPVAFSIRQGLDLQGGTHVVLQAVDTPDAKVDIAIIWYFDGSLCDVASMYD